MLVLTRKRNESIIINDNISIVVVEIRGDKVRLGIEAPKEVPVHRKEVYDAVNNQRATPEDEATAVGRSVVASMPLASPSIEGPLPTAS